MTSMHIGLYTPVWPPGETANGIVTYVRVLREQLRRLGHRVSVFSGACETDEADGIFRVAPSRHRARWMAVRRRLGMGPAQIFLYGGPIADTVLRRHAVDPLDVLEIEESFGWCEQVRAALPLPTVVKLHGPAFLSLMDGQAPDAERRQRIEVEGRALRTARSIVAPSRSTLRATADRYGLAAGAMVAVPNPIAPVADDMVWRPAPEHADDILFVGRFDYRKGGDAMLDAFARVAAVRREARLTFVGPDVGLSDASGAVLHFAAYVAQRLAPDVAARIRFLGRVAAHDVQRLRLQAGVTVAATRWESFGYVVAEAMNQGCPVVAFDVDGVNELITHGETGLLAPLGDIDALAAAILRVLGDPALARRLGARAHGAVAQTCGVEMVAQQMLGVYRAAIDASGTARAGGRS